MAKFNVITEEQARLLVGGELTAEQYQEVVKGVRAVQEGKQFHVSPDSAAEARVLKRTLRTVAKKFNEAAPTIDFRIRMKDVQRVRKGGERKNFDFVVRQAKSDEIEAMEELVAKRRAKRGEKE